MIAVDTNLLVYAHRRDSRFHERAREAVSGLAVSGAAWGIPWPCIHEFYGVVTNARAYLPASTIAQACDQLGQWFASPSLVLLHEGIDHWKCLRQMVVAGRVVGSQIHDARIAAICLEHGVRQFWSADRDFKRFPELSVRDPLLG